MSLASAFFRHLGRLRRIRRVTCTLTLAMIAISLATPWPAEAATTTKNRKAATKSKTGVKHSRKPATKSALKKHKPAAKPAKTKKTKVKKLAHATPAATHASNPGKKKVAKKRNSAAMARPATAKRKPVSRPATRPAPRSAPKSAFNIAPKPAQPVRVTHVTIANPITPIKPVIGTTRLIAATAPISNDEEPPRSAMTACRRNGKVFLLADCNAAPPPGSLAVNSSDEKTQSTRP